MKNSKYLEISQEVQSAIENGKPVVALDSSILTHEMPYPQNVQTAKSVEQMIRSEGAVPAMVAVIRGKIKVGLTNQEIEYLGKEGMKVFRASARDISEVVAKGADASVTISAALNVASAAGIHVLSTGGIGGVHRGAENTMDISADLQMLGKTSMIVVCSGPKSFLDMELTKERLETLGISLVGFGTDEMPAYYYRESGYKTDCRMDTPDELAVALKVRKDLGIPGAVVVANPVPQNMAMSKASAEMAIDKAVKAAEANGIKGKELTPFLMALIKEMTGGMSLDAGIALALANANLAAKTAVKFASVNDDDGQESMDLLRAEIADDTAECIGKEIAALRAEVENTINQRMQGMPAMPYMNPYMNPYQQIPYQPVQNPYQMPQGQIPYQPMQNPYQPQQPVQAAPVQQDNFVNPYKPEPAIEIKTPEAEPQKPVYAAPTDDNWVNPFAPKHEKAEEQSAEVAEPEVVKEDNAEEANVIAVPAEEVMQMVEESVAEEEVKEEPIEENTQEEPKQETEDTEEQIPDAVPEPEKQEEAPATEEPEKDDGGLTEYVPPVHEKKQRKPDNQVKQETDSEGMTAYDPEFYKKRAAERKARIAEAAGEAKHVEEAKAAEPEYIDCKGPLEFTGEHPWAWKCTRCGQVFQKHEIPHKCIKTE